MPDIGAAIGLAQIRKYTSELLPDRKRLFELYQAGFGGHDWAILPIERDAQRESSCHLYMLRIAGADEARRDRIIAAIAEQGVGVNVHYIPMAMLTLFKNRGYRIEDYPNTFALYENEITLPLYNGLTAEQANQVVRVVVAAVEETV
jgi:dTDP-4-amino-4,6-dideoxygalactose transaminase